MIPRFAVIITHNRLDLLTKAFWSVTSQGAFVVIIDNASNPPVSPNFFEAPHVLLYVPDQPPNLSRLWNIGTMVVTSHANELLFFDWDIAYLCDDVELPPGWFDAVSACVREHDAVAGSTHCATPV